jgi:ribosomal protein RSM22 (predicted rRNA methylase)
MISPALPAELRAALEARLEGLSRKAGAKRAASISKTYREGGSSNTIASAGDALAYALARMPATYAAATACLNALCRARPDYAPASLLDVGAGPGTATWAACEAFSSLQDFTMLDANAALRTLALDLVRDSTRLKAIGYRLGEASAALSEAEPADLVVASYLIAEIGETERHSLAESLWARAKDTLLLIEPGTPSGHAAIIALRRQLIACGAHVAAPCPHDGPCPLQAPDWCHFTQRLPRLRAHMQLKAAELPFEDEKFSYVALTRKPVAPREGRVLAQPIVTKIEVTAKLCLADGLKVAKAPRRDKADYARARRWRWGDATGD